MLHQTLELTYRYLELLLSAKEKITHSIRYHHLHLREISAIYTGLFDEENDEDILLLQVLEEVYRATRYENNFHIELETLNQLEQKMESLSVDAKEIFDHMISTLEHEYGAYRKHRKRDIHIQTGLYYGIRCPPHGHFTQGKEG